MELPWGTILQLIQRVFIMFVHFFVEIFYLNFDYVITNSDRHSDRHVQIPRLLKVVVIG